MNRKYEWKQKQKKICAYVNIEKSGKEIRKLRSGKCK